MPASGPEKPPMTSLTTGRPKAEKRLASPLALSSSREACGRARSITTSRMAFAPSGRRHLSPPPRRRAKPPASSRPTTPSPSARIVVDARLASRPQGLVLDARLIGVEDDAMLARERQEASATCPADQRQVGAAGELHAPGGEAGSRDEDRDSHLHRLDHHLAGQPAGSVEDLALGADTLEEHEAGDLVDRVVPADVLHVHEHPVLRAEYAAVNGAGGEIEARGGVAR